jgi:hypothetical protein
VYSSTSCSGMGTLSKNIIKYGDGSFNVVLSSPKELIITVH